MTTSRDTIFANLRTALPESAPLPDLPPTGPWQTFDDPLARFSEVLESVGGLCVRVPSLEAADQQLNQIPEWQQAVVRVSVVDGVGDSTIDPDAISDPHDLESVDFAVLSGHFGVAENAAIWVTDDTVRHRVLYFLPQRLAMVIPSRQIVHNMHEAYGRLKIGQHAFAGFISGPSKTADIEQSLVIGAHGARALTVFAVDSL
ncbi:MAG: LUD domain-containing protein [Planctomycetaceae bacterium]